MLDIRNYLCILGPGLARCQEQLKHAVKSAGLLVSGLNLLFKHCTLGFPVYPIGQVQLDACKRDLQIALAPQGSTLHASLQVPSTHFCGSGQSRSIEHDGVGVTEL